MLHNNVLVCAGGAHGQLQGCSSADLQKLSGVSRNLMGCVGVSLGEMLGFLRTMTPDQVQWMNDCSIDSTANHQQCLQLFQSMVQTAQDQPSSVPGKVANAMYK